ncbi:MAG: transposase [Xenococcaceae cyanobacterium MO_207.B15]|nr:transposase [Xenococcaceae cyanobacterium MO_207.B15]MDJ0742568.1 transposase [Xenococcaceae cyanobacterium MO_167.B27]
MNMTYRIYPDADQEAMMLQWLETCRQLYNHCLRDLKDWLNSRKCPIDRCSLYKEYIVPVNILFPGYLEHKRQLTQWKKDNPWLKDVHSQVTQDVVKRMHNTWEAFKKRGFGFPRFKKYGQFRSFLFPQFKDNPLTGYQLKLPKIGSVLIELHRPIPEGFVIKQVRVLSRARGTKWYVVITVQCDIAVPEPMPRGRGIGVDVGLEKFLTTSDNFTVKPAKFFRDLQSRLKELQRKLSRKKKHSKNWERASVKIALLHHRIANSRKNFHFQVAHQLCDQAEMIFVEDIDFRVAAKGFLSKSMLDGGFGQFRTILQWVCWKRDKYFAKVDHKYSSQICPNCGTHTGKKPLSQRQHICPECGYSTTRDHAAAEILLQRGLASVPSDGGERKLPDNGVLSGSVRDWLGKCRYRNALS